MLSTMRRQKPKVYTLTCLKAICSASSHLSGRLERVVVCYWLNVLSQTLHVMLVIVWRLLLRNATSDVINNNNMSYAVCSNNMIVLYSMTFTIIPRPSLFQGKNHQIPMILLQQMILEQNERMNRSSINQTTYLNIYACSDNKRACSFILIDIEYCIAD